MAREMFRRPMQSVQQRPDYIGALFEEERRLLLVSLDPEEPWEAFRAVRRLMRRQAGAQARVDLYHADAPLEHTADVIPLASRRQAG